MATARHGTETATAGSGTIAAALGMARPVDPTAGNADHNRRLCGKFGEIGAGNAMPLPAGRRLPRRGHHAMTCRRTALSAPACDSSRPAFRILYGVVKCGSVERHAVRSNEWGAYFYST